MIRKCFPPPSGGELATLAGYAPPEALIAADQGDDEAKTGAFATPIRY